MLNLHLIFPPDRHSWNLIDGWERMTRRLGWNVRVFRYSQSSAMDIAMGCKKGETPDLVLAMGGDLHMPELHQSAEIRKIWNKVGCPKVCLSYESLRDSLWPESRGKLESSLEVFTHYAVCDEVDEPWVTGLGRPACWVPQGVDVETSRPSGKVRVPRAFFRGKFLEYEQYAPRRKLLEILLQQKAIDLYDRELSETKYQRLYQKYGGVLNPQGVFGGYNVRTFEALSSGCVLFQQEIPGRPRNAALLRDRQDAILLPSDPQRCLQVIRQTDWDSFMVRRMAWQGPHLARAQHSLEDRLGRILQWIGEEQNLGPLLFGAKVTKEAVEERIFRKGNPPTLATRLKSFRRRIYRWVPWTTGGSRDKLTKGWATLNRKFQAYPTRCRQDAFFHRLLHGKRGGVMETVGSRLPAGDPGLFLRKYWGWKERGNSGANSDLRIFRGPFATEAFHGIKENSPFVVVDNFRREKNPGHTLKNYRLCYAESDQEYFRRKIQ